MSKKPWVSNAKPPINPYSGAKAQFLQFHIDTQAVEIPDLIVNKKTGTVSVIPSKLTEQLKKAVSYLEKAPNLGFNIVQKKGNRIVKGPTADYFVVDELADFGKLAKEYTIPFAKLQKAAVEDSEGVLTDFGWTVTKQYATAWLNQGVRDLQLERLYPDLDLLFYDIRSDSETARAHAE